MVLSEHPAKVATPEVAASGLVVQLRLLGPPDAARVIEADEEVTVLPPASWTVTTGWVVKAKPPVAPAGWVEKMSWAAAPTVTLKALEVALVSEPSVALSV